MIHNTTDVSAIHWRMESDPTMNVESEESETSASRVDIRTSYGCKGGHRRYLIVLNSSQTLITGPDTQVWDEFGSEGGTPQTRQSGVPLRSGARDVTTWSLVATT